VTEIKISPLMQLVLALLVALGIGAVIATQLPEIQRYLKVRKM
jgi:uncharacterized protein DUF6893